MSKRIKTYLIAAFLFLMIMPQWASCAPEGEPMHFTDFVTDKARYAPGESVEGTLTVSPALQSSGSIQITAWHLDQQVGPAISLALEAGQTSLSFSWQPPKDDFQGYLLCAQLLSSLGQVLDTAQVAVDVSSSWVKFPRYGYLWDFTADAAAEEKIAALTKYHVNSLQYYDWQYRHHIPLSPNLEKWQDWSGRWIYGDVLRRYIAAAREHGMVNMAYNMIYGANKTYLRDDMGVDPAWRLVKANGEDFTCTMSESRGSTGILQFFNILNEDWQQYIFRKENEALDALGFDGWHGDTIGEYGRMQTADGKPLGTDESGKPIYYVKDGYTLFLNKAKVALEGKYLTFNPVGAQGIEKVNISDVDVLYSEFWPWEKSRWGEHYVTYPSLQKEIFAAAKESGGKSLVLAAYVNYKNPAESFNPPAVLLLDAVVFASGGARIELGNGDNMLSNEYFPGDEKKTMGSDLQTKVRRMYDFITAYENLLRGGVVPVQRTVALDGAKHSATGASGAIWTFTTADNHYEVLHLINLTGTTNEWRDEQQTKTEPVPQQNVQVKYYTDREIDDVFLASPDGEDITPTALSYTVSMDENGRYISFTVPSLTYWSMVFMR